MYMHSQPHCSLCLIVHVRMCTLSYSRMLLMVYRLVIYINSREFFRLIMIEVGSNSALLSGMEGRRTAVHNTVALEKREFLCVGRCIALSIIYGGPGPHFFSDAAARYLLGLPIVHVANEDIPDQVIATKIKQVILFNTCRKTIHICSNTYRKIIHICRCQVYVLYNNHYVLVHVCVSLARLKTVTALSLSES